MRPHTSRASKWHSAVSATEFADTTRRAILGKPHSKFGIEMIQNKRGLLNAYS
jgi:hypothetical protein